MPESPTHWFKTYSDFYRDTLNMGVSTVDPCLMYRKGNDVLVGMKGLQVDDTITAGNPKFLEEEQAESKEFPSKGRKIIESDPVRFNELDIATREGTINQRGYITACGKVKLRGKLSFEEFRHIRAEYAYAAFSTVPNVLVYVDKLAQFTDKRYTAERDEALRLLRKLAKKILSSSSLGGLRYVNIPPDSAEVFICIDAAFATNEEKSSQLGLLAMVQNTRNGNVNIVHHSSTKSKRVCKSVLAVE